MRQYEAEQRDIAEIKDFIARFGHGTVKMVRQAQSREKLLEKKLEAGLTEKPEEIKLWDWSFPDAGQLPLPVLAIERLSFAYPQSEALYKEVDFGIDLQTRVALVGPNGAVSTQHQTNYICSITWQLYFYTDNHIDTYYTFSYQFDFQFLG